MTRVPCWIALAVLAAPTLAQADAALLLGFTTGARIELPSPRARFLLGAGPDLLRDDGLVISARGELTHVLDGSAVLLAGWMGPGLRSNDGLGLGVAIGPALSWTADAELSVGGRVRASLGLWYARAVVEFDVTVAAPLTAGDDPVFLASLSLRWVPWSPWRW